MPNLTLFRLVRLFFFKKLHRSKLWIFERVSKLHLCRLSWSLYVKVMVLQMWLGLSRSSWFCAKTHLFPWKSFIFANLMRLLYFTPIFLDEVKKDTNWKYEQNLCEMEYTKCRYFGSSRSDISISNLTMYLANYF